MSGEYLCQLRVNAFFNSMVIGSAGYQEVGGNFADVSHGKFMITPISTWGQVIHPCCVKLHAVYVTQRRVYICTELVSGGELLDR